MSFGMCILELSFNNSPLIQRSEFNPIKSFYLFFSFSLESSKIVKLISIGQIRPEKDHKLQLQVLHDIIKWLQEKRPDTRAQLTIAGGCRNAEDKQRVQQLQARLYSIVRNELVIYRTRAKSSLKAPLE